MPRPDPSKAHTWTKQRQISYHQIDTCPCGLTRWHTGSGYIYRWGGAVVMAGECPRVRPVPAVPHAS